MHDPRDLLFAIAHYLGRLLEAAPLKVAIAAIVTMGGWLTTPGIAQAAIWLLIADWATGVLKAMLLRQVHSAAGVRGAVKSLIYLGLLGVCYVLSTANPLAAEAAQWVALAVIYTEAVSNLENLDAIARYFRVDVPLLTRAIAVLRMRAEQIQGGTAPLAPTEGGHDAP